MAARSGTLAAGDQQIEKAASNLNSIVAGFANRFSTSTVEPPACKILAAQGAQLKAHIESHIGAAQWLLGVRMKEHLADLKESFAEPTQVS
jgi:hypothetical protein